MQKYNLSEIMKNAWNNFRNSEKTFAECLHDAWVFARMLSCGKLWENYGKRRVYFDKNFLLELCGLEVDYRKNGNICYCAQNGERISHSSGAEWVNAVTDVYYDCISGEFHGQSCFLGRNRYFSDVITALKNFLGM